ncbi:hypothetical protein ACH4VX_32620 [Streptomyces sp. NPDC020731]|uniref:hypothetical protein n=1 Tax=Streptomyces sp. NPDC020731 TaxID=3365085 RepID=UPI00378CAB94
MHRGTHDFYSEDEEHDEFLAPCPTCGRRTDKKDGKTSGMGRRNKNQHDVEACHRMLQDIQRQTGAFAQWTTTVLSAVHSLGERLEEVARSVDRVADALRDQGVRDAIDTGRVTSDVHRRHLELAQTYRALVTQSLRDLGRVLCPKESDEGRAELARRRARAVAHLVRFLFQPLDQPVSGPPEEIVDRLRELGLATGGTQFHHQFAAVFSRAAALREDVAGLALTAGLDFDVDPTALSADDYQPWEQQQADGAQPEFLVAPAYVVGGDRPRTFSPPIVFTTPADRP